MNKKLENTQNRNILNDIEDNYNIKQLLKKVLLYLK